MELSSYNKSETTAIKHLFETVFSDAEGVAEGALIANLVLDLLNTTRAPDIYGFVARENEQIIACIFFTRLSFDKPIEAFMLAPVAVHTDYQGKGIGQKLINFGIEQLKQQGVELLLTYGDPGFYSKTGFHHITEDVIRAPLALSQPEGWLCQSLNGKAIISLSDRPRCVEAFNKPDYW